MTTATAPERSDQLEEVLLDDKRRGELLSDPAKFRAFTHESARNAMRDGEIAKAIRSQMDEVLEKFVKDQGFDKPVRRLPASDDAAKGGKAVPRREPFSVAGLVSFGEDAAGELYAVSHGGTVYRVAR